MILQLYIRGNMMIEENLYPPEVNKLIDPRSIHDIRKKYFELAIAGMKNKYAKMIENKAWEIFLVVESAVELVVITDEAK